MLFRSRVELVVQEDLLAAVAAVAVDTLPQVKASEISEVAAVVVAQVRLLVLAAPVMWLVLLALHMLAVLVEPAHLLVLQQLQVQQAAVVQVVH